MGDNVIRLAAAGCIAAAAIGLAGMARADQFGDPEGAAEYWREQSYDDCAMMAAADVVGQMTGTAPTEEEITSWAKTVPSVAEPGDMIYDQSDDPNDPNAGSIFKDLPIVLDHYGVPAQYVGGSNFEALKGVLGRQGAVIVNLNGETIWDVPGDRSQADHALVVTGVNTDTNTVHLNDSGAEDGANEQVPIETFLAAWQTSGNEMVMTT
ncbi:C39 family peptidase [Mycobacterium sp. WMMD1722]|uniref:C39 family peptidase n=1 Tax=Mycobacterium sp. WMMD1722 TaxID=3404117 RepID=UPI003BF4AB53